MAHYLVTARPTGDLDALARRFDEIGRMRPFGTSLERSLRNARRNGEVAVWEEEDYCSPPLAQERAAVLDHYFADVRVERVRRGEGWKRVAHLPRLWPG